MKQGIMQHKPDKNTHKIRQWLLATPKANRARLRAWLDQQGQGQNGITHLLHGRTFAKQRKQIVTKWSIS
jgi:hypothetical protein